MNSGCLTRTLYPVAFHILSVVLIHVQLGLEKRNGGVHPAILPRYSSLADAQHIFTKVVIP